MNALTERLSDLAFDGLLFLAILLVLKSWTDAIVSDFQQGPAVRVRDFDRPEDYLPAQWIRHDHPTVEEMEARCLQTV